MKSSPIQRFAPDQTTRMIVQHDNALRCLAGIHQLRSDPEKRAGFGRRDRLGMTAAREMTEHQPIVERPTYEHSAVDDYDKAEKLQIPDHTGNTEIVVLQAPCRGDSEIAESHRKRIAHQKEVARPKRDGQHRVREAGQGMSGRARPYDDVV